MGFPPGRGADKDLGTLVNRKLQEVHMARQSGTLEPAPGDTLPWKGETWPLIWTANYDPDGSGLLVYTKAYAEIGAGA